MSDDEKLKRAFAKLKTEDARRAPSFDELARRGPVEKRRSVWAVVVPLTSLAAAAAVFLVWCGTSRMAAAPAPNAAAPAPVAAGAVADNDGIATKTAVDETPSAAPGPNPRWSARGHDPAPLDFLLELPGASALGAVNASFDTRLP